MFQRFPWPPRPFNNQYRCYSISMFPGKERDHIEKGGKLIMPPSALDQLSQLHISYPMLFKLTNGATDRITHCGVLEFVAEEGKIYMPYWMMQNLLLQEGDLVRVETAELPKATFSKFQPLSLAFLEITNPKAVLENALRNYACLTAGDVIAIHYNDIVYEISVLETKPGPAVSIIECDMNVDFAPPLGYTEDLKKKGEASKDNVAGPSGLPSRQMKTVDVPDDYDAPVAKRTVNAFAGQGQRLDGRTAGKKSTEPPAPTTTEPAPASGEPEDKPRIGIPDYDWKVGTLHFMPGVKLNYAGQSDEKGGSSFEAFTGAGNKLK